MIVDAIFTLLGLFFKFVTSLIPNFAFLDTLLSAKNEFVSFLSTFISYTLYLFNIPVLKISMTILLVYILFLSGEYAIKLILKYVTNII